MVGTQSLWISQKSTSLLKSLAVESNIQDCILNSIFTADRGGRVKPAIEEVKHSSGVVQAVVINLLS